MTTLMTSIGPKLKQEAPAYYKKLTSTHSTALSPGDQAVQAAVFAGPLLATASGIKDGKDTG